MRRMIYISGVSIFLIFLTYSGAWAQNWIFVASTGEGQYGSYVDIDSISAVDTLKFFEMYHHVKGDKSYKDSSIERLYSKSYVNCDARTIGYLEVGYEWVGGMKKDMVNIPGSSKVASSMPVRPNSVDEAILEFVCKHELES